MNWGFLVLAFGLLLAFIGFVIWMAKYYQSSDRVTLTVPKAQLWAVEERHIPTTKQEAFEHLRLAKIAFVNSQNYESAMDVKDLMEKLNPGGEQG